MEDIVSVKLLGSIPVEAAIEHYTYQKTDSDREAEALYFKAEAVCDAWIDDDGYITIEFDLNNKTAKVKEIKQ